MRQSIAYLHCDRCPATRSQRGTTRMGLRKRAAGNGWTHGLLDWPDTSWRWPSSAHADRCGRCTREFGPPRPIGPHEGPNFGKRPHPHPESEA